MNISSAKEIVDKYGYNPSISEDEEFLLMEALEYLIKETGETRWMVELGGYHYENKNYDLALKYYELADMSGDTWAAEGLGYIWYYGRTGTIDYEKAFHYYNKAASNGNIRSSIKVADMYKNGYYVEKDYEAYCDTIEKTYYLIKDTNNLYDPLPEVFSRLARIRKKQERYKEAVELYLYAINFMAQKVRYNPFFGDMNTLKWMIEDLYTMIEVDKHSINLFDLYYLLKTPSTITFKHKEKEYKVISEKDGNDIAVNFNGKWYKGIDDFFLKATINNKKIPTIYNELYDFVLEEGL